MYTRIYVVLFIIMLMGSVVWWMSFVPTKPSVISSLLPTLYVSGNSIFRSDIDERVILRGAVSDYFRYGRFNTGLQQQGLKIELEKLTTLKEAGSNIIGLYLADRDKLQKNREELDEYIAFAEKNRMYVYLMPVEREFNNVKDISDASHNGTFEDLQNLIDFLSSRYAKNTNVMFGFGAEPTSNNYNFDSWNKKQLQLATIVENNAPEALILVTAPIYYEGLNFYLRDPFPYQNVVYMGGGYASKNDIYVKNNRLEVQDKIPRTKMASLSQLFPYMAGEFGGNAEGDFSSETDLSIIKNMLEDMNQNDTHYTMYKLSSNREEDLLSIYDQQGNITKKGKIFLNALQQSLPTQF